MKIIIPIIILFICSSILLKKEVYSKEFEFDYIKIKPKININLSKAKTNIYIKFGNNINIEIQGYSKIKNIIMSKDILQNSKITGKIEWYKGSHSIGILGENKLNTKNYNISGQYKLKF
jgi:hypothetical protein